MQNKELYIYESIIHDMQEGILSISMSGVITAVNPSGCSILNVSQDIIGSRFIFFIEDERNDLFNQLILDAIYEKSTSHNDLIEYYAGDEVKKLFVNTSYLMREGQKIGVIAVLNDVTELMELKDAVVAMNKIKSLNQQLEVRNEFIKKTFGRYLSDAIVNDILEQENGTVIGGEKKVVTILFSDLRGFTAISELMQPQQLIHMLNHYLEAMITVVMECKGTILEFIGDAIVAVFGAPIDSESAAADAVCCAVRMQQLMESVNQYGKEYAYPELAMGVGIHTGEVIIGNIGSMQKTKYDIIGKNVNLASRIESYAVGGQVLISESVRQAVNRKLELSGRQAIALKGVLEPVMVHEVVSIGTERIPQDVSKLHTMDTPLKIEISLIEGENVSSEKIAANVVACSERKAIIESDYLFEAYMDLSVECEGQKLFAKTLSREANRTEIHFTFGTLYHHIHQLEE